MPERRGMKRGEPNFFRLDSCIDDYTQDVHPCYEHIYNDNKCVQVYLIIVLFNGVFIILFFLFVLG